MGPRADPPFPYPPPYDHNLALAQASFATRKLGVKTLESPFSKHRYPRYDTSMAPSSLEPSTCNHRLGQTLAQLATSSIGVCIPHAPPLRIPEAREVNVTWTLPKRHEHTTCLLHCTLLMSSVTIARCSRPQISVFHGLSDLNTITTHISQLRELEC
jgi:hypothetical protein